MSRDEDSDSIEDNRKFPAKSPKQKEAKHSANFFSRTRFQGSHGAPVDRKHVQRFFYFPAGCNECSW